MIKLFGRSTPGQGRVGGMSGGQGGWQRRRCGEKLLKVGVLIGC